MGGHDKPYSAIPFGDACLMSTIAQVESVIERMSLDEQRQLLQWLLVRSMRAASEVPNPDRRAWLARLARLRSRLATGRTSPSVERLLD